MVRDRTCSNKVAIFDRRKRGETPVEGNIDLERVTGRTSLKIRLAKTMENFSNRPRVSPTEPERKQLSLTTTKRASFLRAYGTFIHRTPFPPRLIVEYESKRSGRFYEYFVRSDSLGHRESNNAKSAWKIRDPSKISGGNCLIFRVFRTISVESERYRYSPCYRVFRLINFANAFDRSMSRNVVGNCPSIRKDEFLLVSNERCTARPSLMQRRVSQVPSQLSVPS